jgi:hypothetical protein
MLCMAACISMQDPLSPTSHALFSKSGTVFHFHFQEQEQEQEQVGQLISPSTATVCLIVLNQKLRGKTQ